MSDLSLGTGTSDALIKDTTTQGFAADVIEESANQPVLIDFWAPWCGPCKQLTPIIENAVKQAGGRVKLVKMNIDENPEIPGQMGIQSIPAVIAFVDGRPADGFMGAKPESEVAAFIEKIAGPAGPTDTDMFLDQAEQLLETGEFQQASGFFNEVLKQHPANMRAVCGLAKCAVGVGELEQAKQIMTMVPDDKQNDPMVVAVLAQMDLMAKAADTGEIDALLAKVEADGSDHQSRFDLALALNASGQRQDAATHLLEIMRQDRTWNDDGARKELLTFFEAWGPMDDATKSARRKLSSLLFS